MGCADADYFVAALQSQKCAPKSRGHVNQNENVELFNGCQNSANVFPWKMADGWPLENKLY